MQNQLMELVEKTSMKESVPKFEIGDTVDVHVRITVGGHAVIAAAGECNPCSDCDDTHKHQLTSGRLDEPSRAILSSGRRHTHTLAHDGHRHDVRGDDGEVGRGEAGHQ